MGEEVLQRFELLGAPFTLVESVFAQDVIQGHIRRCRTLSSEEVLVELLLREKRVVVAVATEHLPHLEVLTSGGFWTP